MSEASVGNATITWYDQAASQFADRTANYRPERGLACFSTRVPAGGRVLDAGCGPGRDCRYLAELGFQPIAYDLSRGMLAEGRRRGLSVPAAQGDLRSLPFRDGAFSGVWANASLLHLPRTAFASALRELARVLGEGCLFLALKEGEGEAWREIPGGRRFFTYYRPAGIHAALAEAGFRVAESWVGPPGPDGYPWINVIAARERE